MASELSKPRRLWRFIWSNIDLMVQVVAALLFTVLGILGAVSEDVLWSAILGLLAIVAISQIVARTQLKSLQDSASRRRLSVFQDGFPDEYYKFLKTATRDYFYTGTTMRRTVQNGLFTMEGVVGV